MSNQTNGFTGSIPEDLARFLSLKVLKLGGNKLAGTIPSSIGKMVSGVLKRLDLSNNYLNGRIPSEVGQLWGASILLGGNLFHNSSEAAPLSLCTMRFVEEFDLANDTTMCPSERNALSTFMIRPREQSGQIEPIGRMNIQATVIGKESLAIVAQIR